MKYLLLIAAVLLILKLIGLPQIGWWMVAAPFGVIIGMIVFWVFFMAYGLPFLMGLGYKKQYRDYLKRQAENDQ